MDDACLICFNELATVTLACRCRNGFKTCCRTCVTQIDKCPYCQSFIAGEEAVADSTYEQRGQVVLRDATNTPYGILVGDEDIPGEEILLTPRLQEAIEQVHKAQLNELSIDKLKRYLNRNLTVDEKHILFVKLIEDTDLHEVMRQADKIMFQKIVYYNNVQELVHYAFKSTSKEAIATRAVIAGVGELVIDKAVTPAILHSATQTLGRFTAASAISNTVMFAIFSAIEISRYCRGKISRKEAVVNIGEHFFGGAAGFGGAVAGAAIGSAIGSVAPVAGTIVGGILGFLLGMFCDGFGRWVYRLAVSKKEAPPLTPKEIANKAAEKFGIDVDKVSFEHAQGIFRDKILTVHTDKNADVSEEERERLTEETTDLLACWHIVREYYKEKNDEDVSDDSGYIKAFVLKIRDLKDGAWRIKRMFWDDLSIGRDLQENEVVEMVRIHV